MSNVLEAINKLKLKNSKNHFSNLVLYLPAYSYTGIWNYTVSQIKTPMRTIVHNFVKFLPIFTIFWLADSAGNL